MARGFKTIDQELGWPEAKGKFGDIIQVDFGRETDWKLVAEYIGEEATFWILVDDPISYRVHDERELIAYWERRDEEHAPISLSYELEESAYLDELRDGVSGIISGSNEEPMRHFLICSRNICLEVIATDLPTVCLNRSIKGV